MAALGVIAVVALVGIWSFGNLLPRWPSDRAACRSEIGDEWVHGGTECLHMRVYRSPIMTANPELVVILHGDAPFTKPGYQYAAARRLVATTNNVIAVGLLRPGYTDDDGNRSSGVRGLTTGDNYTPHVVDAIADAVGRLANAYISSHIILVGHSGGAAIVGDVIARHPGLVAGAVLVSCPCDVPAWRRHMDSAQHLPWWRLKVTSLSPMDLAMRVPPHTVVRVVTGSRDPVAPSRFSRAYVQELRTGGVNADLVEIPGATHDILLDPRVLSVISATVQTVEDTTTASSS